MLSFLLTLVLVRILIHLFSVGSVMDFLTYLHLFSSAEGLPKVIILLLVSTNRLRDLVSVTLLLVVKSLLVNLLLEACLF